MRVVVTGGTGFIGRHLCADLLNRGYFVTALGTRQPQEGVQSGQFRHIQADTTVAGAWQEDVNQADLVFNLTGITIFHRWSAAYKKRIYDSRILTTRNVAAALSPKAVLINTSAVGYYGDGGDTELTENSPCGRDFLALLARDWEAEASVARDQGVRVVLPRFGIVLGADGGAMASMLPAFRNFVGGPLGSGRQWFPWIHVQDLIGALNFLSAQDDLEGPVNLCAPNPVRNVEMARALGRVLGRPAKMAVPSLALKMMMGRELTAVLLASQRSIPARLMAAGFAFAFPEIEAALKDLVAA